MVSFEEFPKDGTALYLNLSKPSLGPRQRDVWNDNRTDHFKRHAVHPYVQNNNTLPSSIPALVMPCLESMRIASHQRLVGGNVSQPQSRRCTALFTHGSVSHPCALREPPRATASPTNSNHSRPRLSHLLTPPGSATLLVLRQVQFFSSVRLAIDPCSGSGRSPVHCFCTSSDTVSPTSHVLDIRPMYVCVSCVH